MSKVQLSLRGKCLFVLDDNELTRSSLKRMFEDAGGVVYTSGSLDKSVTALKGTISEGQPPSLIIVDVRLPHCFGLYALIKLNDIMGATKIPLLVVSHGFDELAKRQMAMYGVVGFLEKPILLNHLFDSTLEIIDTFCKPQNIDSSGARLSLKVG